MDKKKPTTLEELLQTQSSFNEVMCKDEVVADIMLMLLHIVLGAIALGAAKEPQNSAQSLSEILSIGKQLPPKFHPSDRG